MTQARLWWQDAVIYQLLVPSFADSNGDGYGDLGGVIERLDYLEWLGIDAIWLSPIYPSPMRELGYDVADYYDVDPRFGSLETFDALVDEAHRRGIRILLDWVPNHTSDRHPWFVESASARDSARRDWYIWRDARSGGLPPNNWISIFGGSVWTWHEPTGQYYLHTFLAQQPDLNWRNPDVRAAMCDTLAFWLERGVDGFRIDAACLLIKDDALRDNPPNPDYRPGRDGPDNSLLPVYTRDQPGLHDVMALIRRTVDRHGPDKVLLGEIYLPIDRLVGFYGSPERPELDLPLCMLLAWTSWDASALGRTIETYHRKMPAHGWPASMLSTHDQCRVAMRTDGEQRRVAAMLLGTLRGTLSHYYGEEIGMRGVHIPPERAIDPQGRLTGRNRDPERTPMQWTADAPHAGFTNGKPWLAVGADYKTANVAVERDDRRSMLSLYRRLFRLRREHPVLVAGRHVPVESTGSVLAYRRIDDDETLLVALNLGPKPVRIETGTKRGEILLSTELDREGERCARAVRLRGDEGVIVHERG